MDTQYTEFSVRTDFPGGNLIVESHAGGVVQVRPDYRDTEGHWFYWNFRVEGAAGQTLRFQFDSKAGLAVGARGPAISKDMGRTWKWLGAEACGIPDNECFEYSFAETDTCVHFSFCIPYQLNDWHRFIASLPSTALLRTLCLTAAGREVPLLELGADPAMPLVLFTARHHCCEAAAGWVLEGVIEAWGRLENPPARLWAIPFMDLDGVEQGDQGKNRRPHDHNRDYNDLPLYPEVAALMAKIHSVDAPFIALDLHCPYVREGDSETVYIVGSADPEMARPQAAFGKVLETVAQGLPYRQADDIKFGEKWNTGVNYKSGKSCSRWMGERPNAHLATTMEIPYANARGTPVLPASCRAFGSSLAGAIWRYMA